VNVLIELLAPASSEHSEIPPTRLSLLEPFEVNYQNWWGFVNVELFSCLYVFLALVAVPHVVLVKNFWSLELLKAVINCNLRALLLLLVSLGVYSLAFLDSREVPLK